MCGAISGFHALVSSGTTPKMIAKESHVRTIGYGAMLIEGLVGVVALIAAASLPQGDYYAINIDLSQSRHNMPTQLAQMNADHRSTCREIERQVGGESLRGRTGGAVTLAVGMSHIFTQAMRSPGRRRGKHRRRDEILVSLRHHVRGAVHPHHDRHRHAHRALSAAGSARAKSGNRSNAPTGCPARSSATAAVTAGWGGADLGRLDRHDLADVRHRQPTAGRDCAGGGDDLDHQLRPRQIRRADDRCRCCSSSPRP